MNDANRQKTYLEAADSLLVSSHAEGFTAALLRGPRPLLIRSITCEPEDRADELYRFLLFYRDRTSPQAAEGEVATPLYGDGIGRLLVAVRARKGGRPSLVMLLSDFCPLPSF